LGISHYTDTQKKQPPCCIDEIIVESFGSMLWESMH
jgi:hypothetical protein